MRLLVCMLPQAFDFKIKLPVKMDTLIAQIMMPTTKPYGKTILFRYAPERSMINMVPV